MKVVKGLMGWKFAGHKFVSFQAGRLSENQELSCTLPVNGQIFVLGVILGATETVGPF